MEKFDKKAIDEQVRAGFPLEHRWHNKFHLEMPFGLINDPNGLAFSDGKYHIFFQWNPLGCEHKNKCWAHTETRDFIHYAVPQLAMWPSDEHDKDGCYSGCGTVEDGQLRVLYTCNRKEDGVRIPAQRFGSYKGGQVKKEEIIVADKAEGYTGHFRDPYIFTRRGKRYFIIGAQREADETGTVLIYEEGAEGWKCLGEVQNRLGEFGYMWECPNLVQFGSYDVLIFCLQGLDERAFDRQNIYQAGYIAGHLSLDSMDMMQHTKFQELDKGFDFYAPQVLSHEGRQLLFGWMGMPDKDGEYPTKEQGWMYSLTMPRELRLRQGHIYSRPAREMKDLRIQETAVEMESEALTEIARPLFDGSEILLDIEMGEAKELVVALKYGTESLLFIYDRRAQTMSIDRNGMRNGGRGIRRFKLFADTKLSLQIFVDKTAVEAFFQHGEEAASILVFPEKNIKPELQVTADGEMMSLSGKIWELDGYWYR